MNSDSASPFRDANSSGRHAAFFGAVAILLAAMAAIQFVTARQESQIYDESNQLLSGYTYFHTGRFTVGPEHPPLLKLLWAIPVAMLRPDPPPAEIPAADPWPEGRAFLYHNHVPADSMLMAGRSMAIAISVLLGFAIAIWTQRQFGARTALLAVTLYVCDPNFIAHGRYIKNDVGAALVIFVGIMTWGAYLMLPTRKRLILSGVVLGLALATKFSTLILLPLMPILYLVQCWQNRRRFEIAAFLRPLAATCAIAFLVVFAVYGFEVKTLGDSGVFRNLAPNASPALSGVPVPALSYIRGLGDIGLKQEGVGNSALYLMGEHSPRGWWRMSPVAFLVKTPLAELALFAMGAIIALRNFRRARWRDIDFRWYLLSIPPVAYFGITLLASFHAGIRHLLPIYPFMFVLTAAIFLGGQVSTWRWAASAACVVMVIVESAAIHPHYLAFFNALAGGPTGGRRYLVDSNLDWGQDVKYLKTYLDANRIPEVCIDYFGMAELEYYGIRARPLPDVPNHWAARDLDCVAAISVTKLALGRDRYAGLEALRPDAKIGYSIYVYDLRKSVAGSGEPVDGR